VIQVYALTTTSEGNYILALARAKHGDLFQYYEKIINKYNKERRKKFIWNPTFNLHDYKGSKDQIPGIESILPWKVISAGTRLLYVF
jgi:hypothetical protein